jgi:hypothetical protein
LSNLYARIKVFLGRRLSGHKKVFFEIPSLGKYWFDPRLFSGVADSIPANRKEERLIAQPFGVLHDIVREIVMISAPGEHLKGDGVDQMVRRGKVVVSPLSFSFVKRGNQLTIDMVGAPG